MEAPGGGSKQGQGRKRPLPLSSGPKVRARAVLYSRIGRPLDRATRGLLASVREGWVPGPEAAAAEAAAAAAAATAAAVDQMVQVSPPLPEPPAAPASPPKPPPPLPEPPVPAATQQPAAAAIRPPRQGAGRLVFLGVAPTMDGGAEKDGEEEAGGSGLLLLAAEVDDPAGGGGGSLDWGLPPGARPARSVDGWRELLARLQQQQQQGQQEPSSPATLLVLTNPLPGLQLLLNYHDTHGCARLLSPRGQEALAGVKACSSRAKTALGLLFSVGPLPEPSSRDAAGPSDGATALWTLLALLGDDEEGDSTSVPGGIKTVAKRGPVRALRVRLPASSLPSSRDVPVLRELEAQGLVALEAQTWGHQCAWTVREAVKEAVGRLAFLYTGKWELVVEYEGDDNGDGGEAAGAGQGQPQQPPGLQWLGGLLQGTVTAAAFGAQPLGSFTAIAATLALLGGHALGLDTAGSADYPDAAAAAAAAVGCGLAHLFQTREHLERLLRARRWRCRMQRAVCGPGARARASGSSSSSSTSDEGVLRLLRQVMWGLYPREQDGGVRPTVGIKDCVRSVIDAEVAARDETLAGGRSVEVSALVYSCTWQWARGILAGASWLGRKGGENHSVAARIFNLLVRMKSLLPFTAGIRRECWVSLTKLQWASVHALKPQKKKAGDDSDGDGDLDARRRRACEALAETYDAALGDYMEEVHGGDRLAMERGRRALRAYMLKARGGDATVDTSPRSGTPASGEFELREGAYREVFVEAAHKLRLKGRPPRVGRRIVFEGGRNVEEVALDAYAALGYRGLFSECRLHRALLRLLLWDQLLDPRVPGAFVCPLPLPTRLPLDLEHGRTFYLRREAPIEARLGELEVLARGRRLGRAVARAWDRHWPACASGGGGGGRWTCGGLTRRGAVELACGLAQAGLLVPILRHLAQNLSAWTRGLPDLVVWAPAGAVKGSLPAGGKAGARPDALSASAEKHVWQRRHAVKRMIEHRRKMQAVFEQETGAGPGPAADGGAFGTPKGDGGVVEPPDVVVDDDYDEGKEEEEVDDDDAEMVGAEVDDLEAEGLEEDEEDEGDSLAAVLLADEPLSPLREMVESQQRAVLKTQAPDVLEEDEEAGTAAAGVAGQSGGCSSYESISVTSAAPSPLPEEDPEVEVKLVEVKSRNDFLSDYQLAWITRFVKHAYPPRPSAESGSSSGAMGGRGIAPPCAAFELCHVRSIKRK